MILFSLLYMNTRTYGKAVLSRDSVLCWLFIYPFALFVCLLARLEERRGFLLVCWFWFFFFSFVRNLGSRGPTVHGLCYTPVQPSKIRDLWLFWSYRLLLYCVYTGPEPRCETASFRLSPSFPTEINWGTNSPPPTHTRPFISPFVSVVFKLSLVHKTQFCMKSYFLQDKSRDASRWKSPTFKIEITSQIVFVLFFSKDGQTHFPPLMFLILLIWRIFSLFFFLKKKNNVFWCCHLSHLLFLTSLFYILFDPRKSHCMLAKREKLMEKCMKNKNKKRCWRYPKHFFKLLVTAIACVQRYIFYEKAKTKKIILTPCAIKLSFICHGFCHFQPVSSFFFFFD